MITPGLEPATEELVSFGTGLNAVVIGAGGGIGDALARRLDRCARVSRLFALSRTVPQAAQERTTRLGIDIEDDASIAESARRVQAEVGELHLVLVATGVLHQGDALWPEKSWQSIDAGNMARVLAVNAVGPALVARHFLPLLARGRKAVLAMLSARVGSITDNRIGGWYSYRASKAALNMLVRTFAIELSRRNPGALCVALHPGTVDTALSRPFQSNVPPRTLFTPEVSARHLLRVLDALAAGDSGSFLAWDGQRIAW